jgi:hypothetical protein
MPDESLSQREREALKRLTTLVAQRAAAEGSLDERRRKVTTSAERERQDTIAVADKEFAKQEAVLAAERQRQDAEVSREYEGRLSAAKRRMDTQVKTYNDRTAALNKAWTREHEESKWLAETLVESGEIKIRNEYEITRKGIEKWIAEVDRRHTVASVLLEEKNFPPLPPIDPEQVQDEPSANKEQLAAELKEAINASTVACLGLERAIQPYLLRAGAIGIIASTAAIGAGAAAYQFKKPSSPGETIALETIGLAILIGGVGAWLLMMALRRWARRFVPRAAKQTIDSLNAAKHAGETCLRRARADRDRQGIELLAKRDEEMAKADRKLAAARREVARRLT